MIISHFDQGIDCSLTELVATRDAQSCNINAEVTFDRTGPFGQLVARTEGLVRLEGDGWAERGGDGINRVDSMVPKTI